MERQYKLKEVCEILSVTRDTLYRWNREGKLRFNRINGNPRISESELQRIVKEESEE